MKITVEFNLPYDEEKYKSYINSSSLSDTVREIECMLYNNDIKDEEKLNQIKWLFLNYKNTCRG